LNEEAGKLLLESFEEFAKKARLMTEIHAKKPTILTATGGANAVNAGEGGAADSRSGGAVKHKLAGRPAGVDKKRSLRRL
jgi:ubiquitin-conjugating enzyme E2 S